MTMLNHHYVRTFLFLCFLASGLAACSTVEVGQKVTGEAILRSASNEEVSLLRNPTRAGALTSMFGSRKNPVTGKISPHRGIDFGVAAGTPVLAASDGILTFRGEQGAYGNLVKIKHSGDIETAYAHLSRFERGVGVGTYVFKGSVIGYVGSTGRSTGPHLHYEISFDGERINPLDSDLTTIASDFDDKVEIATFVPEGANALRE